MKECIVVLGMHRSGTSVLTGLTSFFGLNLGSDLMEPTEDNPKGYFENNKVVQLNDKILNENNSLWCDTIFTTDELCSKRWQEYVTLAKRIILEDENKHLTLIKDPRMCVLFPIWEQGFKELEIPLKVIIIYRNPVEVAHSLHKRKLDGIEHDHGFMLWGHYLFQLERHSREYPRLLIRYSSDFKDLDNLLDKLATFIGKPVTKAVIKKAHAFYTPALTHHHAEKIEKALKPPQYIQGLDDLWVKSGLASLNEIDKLRDRFYYSRKYIKHYQKTQRTKIQKLVSTQIDDKKKTVNLERSIKTLKDTKQLLDKANQDIIQLNTQITVSEKAFADYKHTLQIELTHKSACLLNAEADNQAVENILKRVAQDPVFAKKIKHNIYGYPKYELKNVLKLIVNDEKDKQLRIEKALIADSGLFSASYYLSNNQDIWSLGYDPLDSYCKSGWKEARRPGPDFDPVFYWLTHPDVPRTINPLVHYIQEGKAQGLAPFGISAFLERQIPPDYLIKSGFSCKEHYKYTKNNIPVVEYTDDVLVSILILNRNGAAYLQTLLPMLYENTPGINYEVIVVDNNSDDHSIDYMEQLTFDFPLTIIKNQQNKSFSAANNQAAEQAMGQYLVLLNNDVEPTKGWLNYLIETYRLGDNTGAVGAKLVYPFKHSFAKSCSVQHAGIAFRYEGDFFRPYNMGNGKRTDDASVINSQQRSTLTAACLLVSKDVYFDVGGLDEHYLYGYEDVDFGLKLFKKGYNNRYAANAVLFHHEFGTQDHDKRDEVVKRRLQNLEVFKSKWQRYIKKVYWQEKLKGKSTLFAETILSVAIITNDIDDDSVKALTKALEALSWRVSIVSHKTNTMAEHIDVVISLLYDFDLSQIKSRNGNKRLISIAWIQEKYDLWRENSAFELYDHIFVSSEINAELIPYDNEPQNTSGSKATTRLICFEDKNVSESLYSCLDYHYATPSIAIKVPAPSWEGVHPWGDYHVAVMLKKSLEKEGYRVVLQVLSEWDNEEAESCDVALVLRGLERYKTKPHQVNIMWNISHPDMVSLEEYEEYDTVCIASDYWAKELKQKLTVPVEVVHQCTDIERFYPPTEKEKEQNHQELLFVGNSRGIYRKILKDLLPTKYDLKVIGGGWKGLIPQKYWESSYLDNKELSKHYGSADILLNDHWDDMREKGFVSNRVYDGLASGAFIISDKVRDMGGIKDYICLYETAAELAELIDHHLNNSEERRKKSDEALAYIQENHTFDNRAKQFSKLIKVLS